MSGLIDIFPGHQFAVTGSIDYVTLPKLNALGSPTGRVGENQITARELATTIVQEIGDLRTELDTEVETQLTNELAYLSWKQTLETSYGANLASIATTFATQAGRITDAEAAIDFNADGIADNVGAIAAVATSVTDLEASTGPAFAGINSTLSAYADNFGNLQTYWSLATNISGVIYGRVLLDTTQTAGAATPVTSFTVAADVFRFAAVDNTVSGAVATADNGTGAVTFDAALVNGTGGTEVIVEESRMKYGSRLVINTGAYGAQLRLANADVETSFADAGTSGVALYPGQIYEKTPSGTCLIAAGAMSLGSTTAFGGDFITIDGHGPTIFVSQAGPTDVFMQASSGYIYVYCTNIEADVFEGTNSGYVRMAYNSAATTIDLRNSAGELEYSINGGGWVSVLDADGGGISDLIDDTTPQLGGALDVNGYSITSASNGNITLDPNGTGTIILDAAITANGTLTLSGSNQLVVGGQATAGSLSVYSGLLEVGLTTAVDVNGHNLRVFNTGAASQMWRVDAANGDTYRQGVKVNSGQAAFVADPSGGGTVDTEARAAIVALIDALIGNSTMAAS